MNLLNLDDFREKTQTATVFGIFLIKLLFASSFRKISSLVKCKTRSSDTYFLSSLIDSSKCFC